MGRTLLIGLDGATFTVLDPYMRRGVMPFLRELTQAGARAPLRTIMPPLTPPAWTSLMTGRRPGEHGVFDFFQREAPGSQYYAFTTSQDIRSPTIWSLASEHGKRVVSLNFPVMFPPPPVEGAVVPGGWMPWRQLRLGCHPPGLFDRLKRLPSFDPRELALDMELEAKAIEGCPEDEYADWIRLHTRREQRWLEVMRHLLAEEEPEADLVAIMFDGVDKLQHLCWRFIDPEFAAGATSPWEREMVELCEGYFRRLDETLAEIAGLAGEDVTTVVASDHGFGPTWDLFFVNRWLEEQGYLAWREDVAVGDADKIGFAQMTRHVSELDWDRTVAYAATPTSQGIDIVREAPGGGPMPAERRDALRAEIAERLRQVRNPVTGRPLVHDVLTREEAFPGPHRELAPDLFLSLADGAAMSILRSDAVWRRRERPSGNHAWQGVFLAAGPDIPAGARLGELSITDVAPLVLYALGVPIPDAMSGRLPAELFTAERLERRPPQRTGDAPEPVAAAVAAPSLDPEEEATIVGRLRALGYVE